MATNDFDVCRATLNPDYVQSMEDLGLMPTANATAQREAIMRRRGDPKLDAIALQAADDVLRRTMVSFAEANGGDLKPAVQTMEIVSNAYRTAVHNLGPSPQL